MTKDLLVCVGDTTVNKVCVVQPVAHREASMLVTSTRISFGGRGASVAIMAAAQGAQTALVSFVGDDLLGARLLSFAKKSGLLMTGIRRLRGRSAEVSIFIDKNGRTQSMFFNPGVTDSAPAIQLSKAQKQLLKAAEVVFLTSMPPSLGYACLEALQPDKQELVVALPSDLLTFRKDLSLIRKLLRSCRILILNEWESRLLNRLLALSSAQSITQRYSNIRAVVVTKGKKPTFIYSKTGTSKIPVPRVPMVSNYVGAGDGFAAGLIVTLLNHPKKESMLAAVQNGHVVAKKVVGSPLAYSKTLANHHQDNTEPMDLSEWHEDI